MEFELNMIPKPVPNICESAHECVAPHRNADGKDPRASPQPFIKIIQLPRSHPHTEIPTQRSTKLQSGFQKRQAQTRAPPKQLASNPRRPDVSHLKPIPYPSPTSAVRTPAPTRRTSSTYIPIRQKHNLHSGKKSQGAMKSQIPSLPSNSSIMSSITDPSANHQLRVPRTKLSSPCPTARPEQKRPMSEKAAETVRVMEWTIGHVKAAEKRVREEERAAYKEKEFMLRLRLWEAERKIRKMLENEEEDSEPRDEQKDGKCSDREKSQTFGQSGMRRYRDFFLERRKKCQMGLGIVLAR